MKYLKFIGDRKVLKSLGFKFGKYFGHNYIGYKLLVPKSKSTTWFMIWIANLKDCEFKNFTTIASAAVFSYIKAGKREFSKTYPSFQGSELVIHEFAFDTRTGEVCKKELKHTPDAGFEYLDSMGCDFEAGEKWLQEFPEVKAEYDRISDAITVRFDEIIKHICTRFIWWDYPNRSYRRDGWFDKDDYKDGENICLEGQFAMPMPFANQGIPIRWLWEDYVDEFNQAVTRYEVDKAEKKRKEEEEKRARDEHRQSIMASIRSKLTPEELKWIVIKQKED